jgi:soluble P-type ATPase
MAKCGYILKGNDKTIERLYNLHKTVCASCRDTYGFLQQVLMEDIKVRHDNIQAMNDIINEMNKVFIN